MSPQVTEVGMYRTEDGTMFKVQRSKQSNRLYAKKLQPISGTRLTENDERVRWEFVYDQGAVYRLEPSQRLSLDEAKAFGIRYGICCVCGAFLKDATSVEQGIGPVCGGRL